MDTTVCVKIEISDIGINFEDNQFREVISLSTNIANFLHLEQFSMFRPTLSPSQDPRAWWRYCINAVITQLKQQGKRLSWDELLAVFPRKFWVPTSSQKASPNRSKNQSNVHSVFVVFVDSNLVPK